MSIAFKNLSTAINVPNKEGNVQLYIVHFEANNFYKIGVTGKRLAERFSHYPKFTKIKCWVLPIEKALAIELDAINTFHNYKPPHWKYNRPGKSECFKIDKIAKVIRFVEARIGDEMINFYISEVEPGVWKSTLKDCPGQQIFKRTVPLHQANDLIKLTKTIDKPLDAVHKCLEHIKRSLNLI